MNAEQFSSSPASGGGGSSIRISWVSFTASTGAILGSSGDISVTRNAANDYTITFNTAMPSANYAVIASHRAAAASQGTTWCDNATSKTTTSCKLLHRRYDNGSVEPNEIYAVFIG